MRERLLAHPTPSPSPSPVRDTSTARKQSCCRSVSTAPGGKTVHTTDRAKRPGIATVLRTHVVRAPARAMSYAELQSEHAGSCEPRVEDEDEPVTPLREPQGKPRESERLIKAILYGIMDALIGVPVAVAFTSIIFRDPLFHEDPAVFETLVKLMMFSCFVHQCCFSAGSTLPFALGQVQDAGLIFLSSMATQIVNDQSQFAADATTEDKLATVLISLALSTALLGVALIVTGQLELAQYVQYLPLPVVGGYLAFIGLYCGEAGLSMMTSMPIDSLLSLGRAEQLAEQWSSLMQPDALQHWLPGVLCGIALTVATAKLQHFLVLPCCMLIVPLAFYIVLFSCGLGLEDARAEGWMKNTTEHHVSVAQIYDQHTSRQH